VGNSYRKVEFFLIKRASVIPIQGRRPHTPGEVTVRMRVPFSPPMFWRASRRTTKCTPNTTMRLILPPQPGGRGFGSHGCRGLGVWDLWLDHRGRFGGHGCRHLDDWGRRGRFGGHRCRGGGGHILARGCGGIRGGVGGRSVARGVGREGLGRIK